ncbi:MAG TPA: prolyl oligopeptidase family serine peptidase [Ideonella sp.]|uniref:S9 family peptidase n=1 Tax=Ideonella sp. TaxID=1929293 RepID=UPI002C3CD3E9|nr:prolyl oligopeptidase family serine peptidase [Ideonella sp.]HSI48244.1 prolyl oligopeptidase family serine peptidase [Ideonella sp.]
MSSICFWRLALARVPALAAASFALVTLAHAGTEAPLRNAIAAERARPAAPLHARADFLLQPAISEATLSPDGRTIAYLRERVPGQRELWSQPLDGGAPRRWLQRTEASELGWSQDGRWLLLASSTQLFAQAMAGQPGSGLVSPLGGRLQRRWAAVDPTRPAAVLLVAQVSTEPVSWQLVRVDMHGQREVLRQDAQRLVGFALGPDGRLAWLQRVESDASVIHRVDRNGALIETLRCAELHRCGLLPRTTDAGDLLLRSDLQGSLRGLQRLDAAGRLHPIYKDPRGEADIDELTLDPLTAQPVFADHRSTAPLLSGLDAEMQRHAAALRRALPGRVLRVQVGRGPGARWLVSERGDSLQVPRWQCYDPTSGRLKQVLDFPPVSRRSGMPATDVPEAALAHRLPIRYRASDGLTVRGFLSLPPGVAPAKLPLLALVHGGPWSHATADHSSLAQFLANRGYAVFEPNYRGSTGLGRDHVLAARGDYGGTGRVLQDIGDGVRWLLAQGVGDAQRVGIVGASFGGYAALAGVTFSPDLFKVGVASVPPPDFSWALRSIARSAEADVVSGYMPFEHWLSLLQLDPRDAAAMARLSAQSPLAQAASLRRPVLLIAGGEDRRVDLSGVLDYAARLQAARKQVTLLVDPQAGHRNDDPLGREAALYLMERQLQQSLGGPQPAPPDATLQAYLARNTRLGAETPRLRR